MGEGVAVAAGGGLAVWAAAACIGDTNAQKLKELTDQRKQLKRERDRISSEIKKAEKKRTRDMEKARGLSDLDLLNIIASRARAKAEAKAKAKAKGKGKAKAKAKAKAEADADGDL